MKLLYRKSYKYILIIKYTKAMAELYYINTVEILVYNTEYAKAIFN